VWEFRDFLRQTEPESYMQARINNSEEAVDSGKPA